MICGRHWWGALLIRFCYFLFIVLLSYFKVTNSKEPGTNDQPVNGSSLLGIFWFGFSFSHNLDQQSPPSITSRNFLLRSSTGLTFSIVHPNFLMISSSLGLSPSVSRVNVYSSRSIDRWESWLWFRRPLDAVAKIEYLRSNVERLALHCLRFWNARHYQFDNHIRLPYNLVLLFSLNTLLCLCLSLNQQPCN